VPVREHAGLPGFVLIFAEAACPSFAYDERVLKLADRVAGRPVRFGGAGSRLIRQSSPDRLYAAEERGRLCGTATTARSQRIS
jgi:hypothetical protein